MLLRNAAAACAIAGALLAVATAVLTTVSIAGRALWAAPVPGDVELTQFGVAMSIALCLPWCQWRRANIIVDFFTARAAARTRRALDGAGALLLAAMMALLAWRCFAGGLGARESGETTIILGLPMWMVYAVLTLGLSLTALIAAGQGLGILPASDRTAATQP